MTALTLLLCSSVLAAQMPAVPPAPDSAPPSRIMITILEGEGALNNVRQRTAREPIVEVDDENHRPVAGAVVLFQSPGSGASGTFQGGATAFRTVTGADGRAVGRGFVASRTTGSFQIQVSATFGALATQAVIDETNVEAATTHNNTSHAAVHAPWFKVVLVAAAAGGLATGLAVALSGSSNNAVITPGTPTVGPTSTIHRP